MRAAVLAGVLAAATMLTANVTALRASPLMPLGGLTNVQTRSDVEQAHWYRRHWGWHRRHYGWWRGRHYGWWRGHHYGWRHRWHRYYGYYGYY